jgi:N-acetyl-beta-hexosaminidase
MALSGAPVLLAPNFTAGIAPAATLQSSPRLARAMGRFNSLVSASHWNSTARSAAAAFSGASAPLFFHCLAISVTDMSESLNTATDYSYTLEADHARPRGECVALNASSIYGAMYGMETFAQLVDTSRGALTASSVRISDSPDHVWRGLLVDAGRRFAPVPLLHNILDTMAAAKLNVLHLHASDVCRFG